MAKERTNRPTECDTASRAIPPPPVKVAMSISGLGPTLSKKCPTMGEPTMAPACRTWMIAVVTVLDRPKDSRIGLKKTEKPVRSVPPQ